ncbi:MAG: hypothetical protein M1816_005065 [Peltula sp. TS41687]|nr:MAG: hypothetical protein M1816_005065 [Peltula sp. TS41687]
MAELVFQITPPRASDPRAQLSPRTFLKHPSMLSPLKRAASLNFGEADQKQMRFDPPPSSKDDVDMIHYCKRLGPDRLTIRYPISDKLNELRGQIKDLRAHSRSQRERIKELECELETVKRELETVKRELEMGKRELEMIKRELGAARADRATAQADRATAQARLEAVEAELQGYRNTRLNLMIPNLLVDFIEFLYKRRNRQLPGGSGHASTRYDRAIDVIRSEKWIEGDNALRKYQKSLNNLAKYRAIRNATAHESEIELAKMLVSPAYRDSLEYRHWSPLFAIVYGVSVEEMAGREEEDAGSILRSEMEQ